MEGHYNKPEKIINMISFMIVILSIITEILTDDYNIGTLVILAFMGILWYIIFLICGLFPATWRMTQNQKAKISDKKDYQNKYRKIFMWINLVGCIMVSLLIITIS